MKSVKNIKILQIKSNIIHQSPAISIFHLLFLVRSFI